MEKNNKNTGLRRYVYIVSHCFVESEDFREAVAKFRRKCQRVRKEQLVFLDGTGFKSEARRGYGLAPKGKKAKVETKKQENYQPRLDIWGAVTYNRPLAIDIQTSEDRKKKGVKGYGKKDVKLFLRKKVAPEVKKIRDSVIVCLDRGFHFKPDEVEDELKAGGAGNIEDVWIFPTNGGKVCNPLDNTLWHSMKQRVRRNAPKDEPEARRVVKKTFMNISAKDLRSYFKNCGLNRGTDPYKDL